MNNIKQTVFLISIAVFAISLTAPLVVLVDSPAATAAGYRMFFATIIVAMWALYKKNSLLNIDRKTLGLSCLAGLLLGFHFITWFSSLDYTSVASSVTLATMQPLFAFIIGFFIYNEKLNPFTATGALIAIMGGIIIGWGDFNISGMALWGDFLALSAAGFATIYFFIGQAALRRIDLTTYTFYCYGFASSTILIYCLTLNINIWGFSNEDFILFILLAIFPTIFGHSILNFCTRTVSVSSISMAMLCEPVGASLIAFFLLGSIPTFTQVSGAFLTLLGVYIFIKYQNIKTIK